MSQWNTNDIKLAVDEVRTAGGDTGKFLADIAEENPTVRTVEADVQQIMTVAQQAYDSARQTLSQLGPVIQKGEEIIEEECGSGGCIPPP